MKKVVCSILAVLSISAASFARDAESGTSWNFDVNINQLSHYLQLSSGQAGQVADICNHFSDQMNSASFSSPRNRKEKFQKAIYANLKLMKSTLTEEQYRKYVRLLNVTMKNKGVEL